MTYFQREKQEKNLSQKTVAVCAFSFCTVSFLSVSLIFSQDYPSDSRGWNDRVSPNTATVGDILYLQKTPAGNPQNSQAEAFPARPTENRAYPSGVKINEYPAESPATPTRISPPRNYPEQNSNISRTPENQNPARQPLNSPNRQAPVVPAGYEESSARGAENTPGKNPPREMAMRTPGSPESERVLPEDASKIKMSGENDALLAFTEVVTTGTGTYQQVTIIDPKQRSLCVYHIDMSTGQIELRGARDIQWDLQLNYLNSKKPYPHEIKGILQGAKK